MKFQPVRFALFGLVAFGGCDCENRIRSAVSDRPIAQREPIPESESSKPRELEPNDTPESANAIVLTSELRPISGIIDGPADTDWFAVSAPPGLFELTITPDSGLDVSVHLSGFSLEGTPTTYNIAGVGLPEVLPAIELREQPLFFAVRSVGSSVGNYEIQAVLRVVAGHQEVEPNDSAESATRLKMSDTVQGMFDRPDDRDIFQIEAAQGEGDAVVRFDFQPARNLSQTLSLYNASDLTDSVASIQLGEGAKPAMLLAFEIFEGTSLFVVVEPTSGFDRQAFYTLKVERLGELATDVEIEPNDKLPRPIAFPGKIRGFFHSPEDIDRFTVGTLPVELSPEPTEGKRRWKQTMNMKVRKLHDNVVVRTTVALPESTVDVQFNERGVSSACGVLFTPGDAEIVVRAEELRDRSEQLDYELELEDPSSREGFEIEPNNSREEADDLSEFRMGLLEGPDAVDYFAFDVSEPGERITLTAGEKGLEIGMRLEDETGALISDSNLPGAALEKIEVDLPAGRYFAVVYYGGTTWPLCEMYRLNLVRKLSRTPLLVEDMLLEQLGGDERGEENQRN